MAEEAEHVYAVDIVSDIIRRLSGSEPVFFQRDGQFFAASTAGFGWLRRGLNIKQKVKRFGEEEYPEILESLDITYEEKPKNKYEGSKLRVVKKELGRVMPLIFGSDDDSYNLKNMAKTAEVLGKLKPDGKIRLVSHGSGYHSHKYGYAADGMDFWLSEGRVMDKARFFQLMREKEETLLTGLEKKANEGKDEPEFGFGEGSKERILSVYNGSGADVLPDALVITPHFLFTFPRTGQFRHRENEAWTTSTGFIGRESPVRFYHIGGGYKSPFAAYFKTNSINISALGTEEFNAQARRMAADLALGTKLVAEIMPQVQQYIERLNNMNNTAFAKDIVYREELQRVK